MRIREREREMDGLDVVERTEMRFNLNRETQFHLLFWFCFFKSCVFCVCVSVSLILFSPVFLVVSI